MGWDKASISGTDPLITSFPLNKVHDELGDFWASDDYKAVRVFDSFFSHGERVLDLPVLRRSIER
jgi:hypothetical protein